MGLVGWIQLAGVFNWVLAGLHRLLDQQGFTDCQASRVALDQYKIESDSVRMFMQDTTMKPDPIRFTKLKELYPEYRKFCQDDGFKPFSKRNFKKHLERSGIVTGREGGTGQVVVYLAEPMETIPF
jgi:putative DNA primase/helicase